jgi:Fe-S-cluster-containing dehydrogenase component/Ni/Fe-hydrogenase subunit HybB-like protein
MQLGFVIDQSRCIGCHACTVACKSENDVPVGSFRTWVKYTEKGEFPSVKRSFSVMRCNQCTDAPCVSICPTGALEKRLADGIVDLDKEACIGCKSCMHGCPYDALYINDESGTAEKCHFCAHRTEVGLAPACAVVCPTEAIIPGDFDDPTSVVSRIVAGGATTVRKPEAATKPNVHYVAAAAENLDPTATTNDRGYLWSNRRPGMDMAAAEFAAMEQRAAAPASVPRTTYDAEHTALWGWKISGYLLTKSIAAGALLALLLPALFGLLPMPSATGLAVAAAIGLLFLTATSALLVLDLKRPDRFLYILLRPNFSSWLVKGTYLLMGYGALATACLALGLFDLVPTGALLSVLAGATCVFAALAACYTGWLFGQSKGRVLWMRRGLWAHLIVQAGLAGTSVLILIEPLVLPGGELETLRTLLVGWLGLHLAFMLAERFMAPQGREHEYHRVQALIERGPFAFRHWAVGFGLGIAAPVLLCLIPGVPLLAVGAALLALVGLASEEDLFVRAGQALPIS